MKVKKFDFEAIRKEIQETSLETSIYVGCDSIQHAKKGTNFVTVIVLHYDSKHGAKCYYHVEREDQVLSLRHRLLKEVYKSVGTALEIVDACGERNLECHLDINPDKAAGSNIVHKEAMAYARGQGLKVLDKPYSFAAYAIADYFVRAA